MMKRIISLTMCAIMLLSAIVISGCAKKSDESLDAETAAVDTDDTYVAPDVDYNGMDFNVMRWTWDEDWVLSTTEESSPIEQQTYYHLMTVERELNLKFKIAIEQRGEYGHHGSFVSKVLTLTGQDNIDLICQYSLAAALGAQQGLYANLLDLKHIKWDGYYWSDSLYEYNAVNGKMYYCTGDLTGTSIKNMFVMLYNYDMANNHQMGNLYELVDEGKWTIDKLKELSKNIYIDENDNGKSDVGDTFGLVIGDYRTIDAFQAGANLISIVKDENNKLIINEQMSGEYGVSVVDKLKDMAYNTGGAYCNTKLNEEYGDALQKGKAVFTVSMCDSIIDTVSHSDINYGILPMPKYNEDQQNYHTCLNMTYNMYSVPNVARDMDMSGAVLESLSHSGNRNLIPVIYEALQYKYSQRTEDTRMLEIIRKGIIYDPGRTFDQMGIYSFVRTTVRDNAPHASAWEGRSPQYYGNIDAVNKIFE